MLGNLITMVMIQVVLISINLESLKYDDFFSLGTIAP